MRLNGGARCPDGGGTARERLAALGRGIAALEGAFATASSVAVLAIMAIVSVDVLLRYAFNSPLAWSFDLISMYLLVAVFFLSLSDALQDNHHVAVDILFQHISPRLRRTLQLAGLVLALPLFAAIGWLAFTRALEKLASGDVVAGAIAWPTWPGSALVALGTALIVVRILFRIVALGMAIAERSADVIGTPEPTGHLFESEI